MTQVHLVSPQYCLPLTPKQADCVSKARFWQALATAPILVVTGEHWCWYPWLGNWGLSCVFPSEWCDDCQTVLLKVYGSSGCLEGGLCYPHQAKEWKVYCWGSSIVSPWHFVQSTFRRSFSLNTPNGMDVILSLCNFFRKPHNQSTFLLLKIMQI